MHRQFYEYQPLLHTAKRSLQFALIVLTIAFTSLNTSADEVSVADTEAMSGEPERIQKAISMYNAMDIQNPEIQWRLIRAYYNYYDELTDRDLRKEQKKAADTGYALAKESYLKYPGHLKIVYYYASIASCYLEYHRFRALFMINDIIKAFEKSRQLDPAIDDAGPDRSLGLIYYLVPVWRDKKKALQHLQTAAEISPERAANRLPLAKILAEQGRYEEGWEHIEFIRAGKFKVSSPHWREIYLRRVEEVAKEFPQNKNSHSSLNHSSIGDSNHRWGVPFLRL